MKIVKILLVLVLSGVGLLWAGCASKTSTAQAADNQTATVQRGNLTVDISANGNLKLATAEDLKFEIAGTVAEVMVKEGQSVTQGQVLVTLDDSDWQDQVATLERTLKTKQRDLLQAQISVKNTENTLDKTQNPYTADDIATAQFNLESAQNDLYMATWRRDQAEPGITEEQRYSLLNGVLRAQASVRTAQAKLDTMLAGPEAIQVELKKLDLELAKGRLEDAQQALKDAQKSLDEAKKASPEIKAPFSGFVTKINVTSGEEVNKNAVALQVADPNKFQADVLVSERDISKVSIGGIATVRADATSLSLPARVTAMAPTATISQGVVNYKVTVEVQSLASAMASMSDQMQRSSSSANASGQLQRPSSSSANTTGQGQQSRTTFGRQGSTTTTQAAQLRDGLSVSVSILVEQKNNVLLVPNRAISRQGGNTVVTVLKQSDKKESVTEVRPIKIGINDSRYTEVAEGLSEGELVVVPKATATQSAGQQQQQMFRVGGGMIR
ncbi:MAG: HlyD family efflux transporter periplasmic adaptor subunit [Chloroflexi bacterium]|nr:HlyD family efflux transporter periplasmic adaptor subunit [Chloroflexota bacterium]